MRRHGIFLLAAFFGGMLVFIGPWWLGCALLAWPIVRAGQLLLGWLILASVLGLAWGWHAAALTQRPPVPVGAVLVMPADWLLQDNFVRYTGTAANGVPISGSATVTPEVAQQLQQLATPALVQWRGPVSRLAPARNQYEFDFAAYAWRQNKLAYQSPRQPLIWERQPVHGVVAWLHWVRARLEQRINRLPAKVALYANGLLLGRLDAGFDEVRNTYVDLGIFHFFPFPGCTSLRYWLGCTG